MAQMIFDAELQEGLQHIAARLTTMCKKGIDVRGLGYIALELLFARNKVEEALEENCSAAEKEYAKKLLNRINELEKCIISLYALGKIRRKKLTKMHFFSHVMRGYGRFIIEAVK